MLALIVPEETRKDFERAFLDLKMKEPALSRVDAGFTATSSRGKVDFSDVRAALRVHDRVVVFLDSEVNIPSFLVAAADKIEPVHAFDAAILLDAVKEVHEVAMDPADAARMMAYPITDVLSALRRGRSHAEALRRLKTARDSGRDNGVPLLESLSGYGQAADWARSLLADIDLWREGRLPWSDLDAGLLLSGPPGTGKTLFARSLARSCDASFVASSIAQWQSAGHLGDMLKAMRATFKEAADRAPCILLLDEFDSVGDRTRFTGHNAQYCTEVVAALLECLDGAFRREGVIVVGACNHPDRIDAALLRPGRLGRHFALSLPDTAARKGILATHIGECLRKKDLDEIAAATLGFSGADLAQLVKDGRRKARMKSRTVTVDDILSSLPPATPIDGKLRDRICIHEAGHAAAVIALDVGRLMGVAVMDSFRDGIGIGGGAHFDREARLQTAEYFRNSLVVQLAGMAAEAVLFGDHLEGSGGRNGSDLQRAADIATTMVAQLGMGGITNFMAAETIEDLDRIRRTVPSVNQRVEKLLADAFERAKELVKKNEEFICELAVVLNWEGGVDGDRATSMFDAMEKSDAE
ncbi:AAA family ATPase [Sinorhizobium terangae]|uniref:AAA family ATPase n=1 Tax=Sinorhizobium terangae TaxID=110322 RepID=UPI0024B0E457|nr:AAA family ATPase [Sinorhizobium terangae]WFU49155.1 AAA family ATPase [Sinorhizobium terangae]